MKKNKIFYSVATTAAALVMTAAPIIPTFAAYDGNKAESNATFKVTEASDGGDIDIPDTDKPDTSKTGDDALQLVAVPSFDFGEVSTTQLLTGKKGITPLSQAKDADGNIVDDDAQHAGTTTDAADATTQNNPNYHLTVSDLRGVDKNEWTLTAGITAFNSDDKTHALNGTLNLISTQAAVDKDYAGFKEDVLSKNDFANLGTTTPVALTTGTDPAPIFNTADHDDSSATTNRGISVASLGASTLDLDADKTAVSGHYDATITWQLATTVKVAAATGADTTTDGSGN